MIEVGRNSIIIRDVDVHSEAYKRAIMTYSLYDKVYHKYTFSVFSIVDQDLYFPASIGVDQLKKIFKDHDVVQNTLTTAKSQKIEYNMIHQPKNELQQKAISFLLKMKKDTNQRSRFLSLATGSGKTYVSINIISCFKKRAMIVVDSLSLADQWKREFLNHTDLKESDIKILSGQDSVDSEIKSPSAKIYIAIHRTLNNILDKDTNGINQLMNKLKIGIRIFDESHVDFGSICKINALSNVEYTIYLSATPSRSNFMDNSLYAKVFGLIPYFNGKELATTNYHTVIIYPINSNPSIDVRAACRSKYGFAVQKWGQYMTGDAYQIILEAIINLFTKLTLLERKKKTAIVLPTIELIKKLKHDLEIQYPDTTIGMFIGEVKKDKRQEELNKEIILTDEKMFGKAMDVKGLEVLINCVDYGNVVSLEQTIGRLRYVEGQSQIYIDVVDFGFNECKNHFKKRKTFYRKYAKKIIEFTNV